jgi:hypothetical protein
VLTLGKIGSIISLTVDKRDIDMITASEARKLAGPTPQERVDMLEPAIREAATAKKRSITLFGDFWAYNGGVGYAADHKRACEILEGIGYKVSSHYCNDHTIVEW